MTQPFDIDDDVPEERAPGVEAAFVVLRDLDTDRWRFSHAGENRWRTISTCAMIANPHGARLNVFTPVESRRRRLSALPFQIALS